MLSKIIGHKHFWKVVIVIVIIAALSLYFNKKNKEEQFQLLMQAVNESKGSIGSAEDLKTSDPFNPRYWKTVSNAKVITSAIVNDLVKFIWDAKAPSVKNPITDDEKGVLAKFRTLGYKTQVSYLAEKFLAAKSRDLYEYLNSFMSKDDMEALKNIVNGMK